MKPVKATSYAIVYIQSIQGNIKNIHRSIPDEHRAKAMFKHYKDLIRDNFSESQITEVKGPTCKTISGQDQSNGDHMTATLLAVKMKF